MNRSILRMLSGAAGLLAAFTAISLPLLLADSASDAGRTSLRNLTAGTMTLLVVRISLAIAAWLLLRFSLSHAETDRLLKFHSQSRK